ncbi:MAG: DUF4252 domain-containing protein [Bacteroidetes bacterium]|nr:DUF4252 domain-containing protein [Bacteroidota bacterium]
MKKISYILLILFLFQWSCITDQNKYKETDIFEEYETQAGFTVLHLPPVLFKIVFSLSDESDIDSKKLLDKIDVIKVMFFEQNEKTSKLESIKESMNTKVEKFEYNLVTRIAQEDNDIAIYVIESDKIIHEVLIVIVSDKEYIGLNFVGEFTKEDVMKVYESINMQKLKNMDN